MSKASSIAVDINVSAQERGTLTYGEDSIHYEVIRRNTDRNSSKKNASSRKIIIKVHPDQRVVATAPYDATMDAIQKAVLKRARWISNNIAETWRGGKNHSGTWSNQGSKKLTATKSINFRASRQVEELTH